VSGLTFFLLRASNAEVFSLAIPPQNFFVYLTRKNATFALERSRDKKFACLRASVRACVRACVRVLEEGDRRRERESDCVCVCVCACARACVFVRVEGVGAGMA
jgi:hypothetical protein